MTKRQARRIAQQLRDLQDLSTPDLRARWCAVLDTATPPKLKRELLLAALAFELQVAAYGGLGARTRRALTTRSAQGAPGSAAGRVPLPVGTRLVRVWQGRRHTVEVSQAGYVWQGHTHRSLSAVARAITGTRWSGPRFFGVQDRAPDLSP